MVDEATSDNLPRRLGRYDVVGVLAKRRSLVGSTILIATARNGTAPPESSPRLGLSFSPLPATEATTTFQRPVAIKRLAPALARDEALVAPFLETARAVTGIRHANIAQIHEVGHMGDEVFLVMDYLLGETAATLMRRLHSRGESLDFRLGAFIIAEAAAGLEAAHSKGILHEQLTPHELFIGYDGTVRVLDVGVAAAHRKIAGGLGGAGLELEYASPERCKKETLDRRSDVFSLGTMLWELNAGLSPFERAKEADTIRAICDEPIVPPGNVIPGLPRPISTITMQALARDKAKRFQTASALRDALAAFLKTREDEGSPAEELAQVMRHLFESRVGDKREMLRRIEAGKPITGLDVGEAEETREAKEGSSAPRPPLARPKTAPMKLPKGDGSPSSSMMSPAKSYPPRSMDEEPSIIVTGVTGPQLPISSVTHPSGHPDTSLSTPGMGAGRQAVADQSVVSLNSSAVLSVNTGTGSAAAPARARRFPLAVVVALLLLGGIALVLGLRKSKDTTTADQTAAGPSALPSSSPPPTASSAEEEVTPPTAAPAPSVVPSATTTTTATTAVEETVLHIETVPPHATILVDGAKKGVSPIDVRLTKSSAPVMVEIRQKGFQPLKERVVPDMNQRLKLTLVAVRGVAPPPTGSAPYHKFE